MRQAPHRPPTAAPQAAARRARQWLGDVRPDTVDAFWADVAVAGTPLVAPDPMCRDRRLVTFLWRADEPLQGVYVRLNRVTDKHRVADGLMMLVPGTTTWRTTLSLPAGLRCSYQLCPIPVGQDEEVLSTLGGRTPGLPLVVDPFRRGRLLETDTAVTSVLALDAAPPQPEWSGTPAPLRGRLTVDTPAAPVAGQCRQVWHYLPDPGVQGVHPLGLLVLLDGEVWFGGLGVAAAIEAAVAAGRVPPMAILGVENIDTPDRVATLGGRPEIVREIADRLVPRLRAAHPDRTWAGREATVLCGQSLGGVTALLAALEAPEAFGHVLAHSPSMWWHPGRSSSPADLAGGAPSWITEQYGAAPVGDVTVRIDVGSLEGMTVPRAEGLRDLLADRGWDVVLDVYTGGHDFACWRGALLDGLSATMRGPATG